MNPKPSSHLTSDAAKQEMCPSCDGRGTEADYVGLEMRCVETECTRCGGKGFIIVPGPSAPDTEVAEKVEEDGQSERVATEQERVSVYRQYLSQGFSDYEAREMGWPSTDPFLSVEFADLPAVDEFRDSPHFAHAAAENIVSSQLEEIQKLRRKLLSVVNPPAPPVAEVAAPAEEKGACSCGYPAVACDEECGEARRRDCKRSQIPASPVESGETAKVETRKEFEGCITEIGANKTLSARDDYNKGWNDASDNAIKFIRAYIAGEGLFQ